MSRATRASLSIAGTMAAMAMLTACGSETAPEARTDLQAFLPALDTPVDAAPLPPLPQAQPLTLARPATPLRTAPAAGRLTGAPALGWADPGDQGYAWIDRADTLFDVIGDAPPDYGFDYGDGVEPWGWDALDGHSMYAEPIDGGYRQYFYEPGSDDPFFVRDPWNGYGYSDGRIASVFDGGGGLLPLAAAGALIPIASNYFGRGRDLRRASYRQPRYGVAAPRWAERQPYFSRARQQWAVARDREPRWSEWRARRGVEARPRVRYEREARRDAARRFADWRGRDFRGDAPRLYDQRRDRAVTRASARRDDRIDRREFAGLRDDRRGARLGDRGRAVAAERARRGDVRQRDDRRIDQRRGERASSERRASERRADQRDAARSRPQSVRADRPVRETTQRRQQARGERGNPRAREQQRRPQFAQERAQRRQTAQARANRPDRQTSAQRPQREARAQRQAQRPQREARAQRQAQRPQRDARAQRQAQRAQRDAQRPQRQARVERQAQRPQREARGSRQQVARADRGPSGGGGDRRGGNQRGGGRDRR